MGVVCSSHCVITCKVSCVAHPITDSVKSEPFEVKLSIQVSTEAWVLFAFFDRGCSFTVS